MEAGLFLGLYFILSVMFIKERSQYTSIVPCISYRADRPLMGAWVRGDLVRIDYVSGKDFKSFNLSENGTDFQLADFESKCLDLLQNCTLTDVGLRRPVFIPRNSNYK